MFLLVRSDGSIETLPGVAAVENDGQALLCLDEAGEIIARYNAREVLLYGQDRRILPLMDEYWDSESAVRQLDGRSMSCSASACNDTATVSFRFAGSHGEMNFGLCETHESLVNENAKTIAFDELDMRRMSISRADP